MGLRLWNSVPYLRKKKGDENNKYQEKVNNEKESIKQFTFWISSLRTGSKFSNGVCNKEWAYHKTQHICHGKYQIKHAIEITRTKERTRVLSRMTNNIVVFRGLNNRIITFKSKLNYKIEWISSSGIWTKREKHGNEVGGKTWKTVFKRGLFAACSRPISWHHLYENSQTRLSS